jgi:hypothetical protein
MSRVAPLILHGALGGSAGERIVDAARRASTRDLVGRLRAAGAGEIHLITNDDAFAEILGKEDVTRFTPSSRSPFHVGRAIAEAVHARRLDGVVYFGSGTGGLLSEDQLAELLAFADDGAPAALLNNPFSVDFAAISGARHLAQTALPENDNALGFALVESGFACRALPRDLTTQFDLDTPTDAALLAATDRGGDHLRRCLLDLDLPTERIGAIQRTLTERSAHVYLLGRVNPKTWAWFESQVACRTSGILEGRGMRGYPTGRGTLLGSLLDATSPRALFDRLGTLCDAALIDCRPLLSPDGRLPPASDRFATDLLRIAEITDPRWASFAVAAAETPLPVLLGGHNLVCGGLYLLGESCWRDVDLARRLPVDPPAGSEERDERPYPRRFPGEDRSPSRGAHPDRGTATA